MFFFFLFVRTKLIHDRNNQVPKYHGLVHGTKTIIKEEGIAGIYRGLGPVVARQGANSAVRFSSYSYFKSTLQKLRGDDETTPLPSAHTFAAGAMAGIVTVYTTMPLDVVKTRMQGLDARQLYKHSLDCLIKVVKEHGVFSLWKGTTPRLTRLIVSEYIYMNIIYIKKNKYICMSFSKISSIVFCIFIYFKTMIKI